MISVKRWVLSADIMNLPVLVARINARVNVSS